jgi:hypothetical protein
LTPETIIAAVAKAPHCRRVTSETGRMASMLYHSLNESGVPVVCIESRQAHQALESMTTHKTERNDARGLAHLARTGFFKPVDVKPCRGLRRQASPGAHCRLSRAGSPPRHQAGASQDRGQTQGAMEETAALRSDGILCRLSHSGSAS